MGGLIKEGGEVAAEDYVDDAKDSALIGAAQRVEHHEIAAYGTARTMAKKRGQTEAYELLSQTLQEEKDTDVKLSDLADQIQVVGDREEEAPRRRKAKAARA
jgi:ferritin-like metal-binding protein YciE